MVHIHSSKVILLTFFLLLAVRASSQSKRWTLAECIDHALAGNIVLKTDVANNEINKVNYLQAKAERLPNLNLTDAHSFDYSRNFNTSTGKYEHRDIWANNLALTSSITLFNGFRNTNLIKENRMMLDAGLLNIGKQQNALMLDVIAAFLQVLYEYDAVAISNAQVEVTKEHLSYTEKHVKAGNMPESTLFQLRAQLAADEATVVETENQLRLAKVTLMQLMELPVTSDFELTRPGQDEMIPGALSSADDIYSTALAILPEVKESRLRTSAAAQQLTVSQADLFPKLTLSGSLGTSYSSLNSLYSYTSATSAEHIGYLASDPTEIVDAHVTTVSTSTARYPFLRQMADNLSPGISLNLSVPLFNNRLYKSNVERSRISLKAASLNETLVSNQLRKAVEIAYTEQVAAGRNYIAAKKQKESEERSYHDMEIRFRAGTANATDLYVEKGLYTKASLSLIQARYQYMFKSKVIDFYLGNLTTQLK